MKNILASLEALLLKKKQIVPFKAHVKKGLIVLGWLFEILKETPKDNWSDIVLAYDAMCKLDGLKVCQKALPLLNHLIRCGNV